MTIAARRESVKQPGGAGAAEADRPRPAAATRPNPVWSSLALGARPLTVSRPDDPSELEAERIANQVMTAPASPVTQSPSAPVQRSCAACESAATTCASCEEEELVQRQAVTAAPRGLALPSAPPIVHEVLRSAGQPLGTPERAFMEPRFGQDFSGVRIHTGAKAAESAAAVRARAYTVGNDIVFGGKESASDLPVLAHELTHVVQQSTASPAIQRLAYCADFLDWTERPGVAEYTVRDSLANDAEILGKVVTELPIPEGTAAPQRTERKRREINPFVAGERGSVDVALLMDDSPGTLEFLEVKKATWEWDGATFAEGQLERYLRRGNENPDIVTENWRRKRAAIEGTPPNDEIASVEPMPMGRLPLWPNPRFIDGVPVLLRWCDDGIVVFKPAEEEEEEDNEPEDEEPKDTEPDTSESIPEQLAELGLELLPKLAKAQLVDIALSLASGMGAFLTSPFVALAAVVLGIVYFWDEIKAVAGKIAGIAQAVWDGISKLAGWVRDGISWVQDRLHDLRVKLAEAARWVAGQVASLVEKLLEGAEWVAGRLWSGAKWIGRGIASGAEAIWDWLWGSDVEALPPPIFDMHVEEPIQQHCATVAYDDAIVRLPADLLFDTDESVIKPEAEVVLKEAAAKIGAMRQKDDWLRFEGYADPRGTEEHNQRLSEHRAAAVAKWFVDHGVVPQSSVRTEGYGETMAQGKDEKGWEKDRRVDIWLPKHGSSKQVCW